MSTFTPLTIVRGDYVAPLADVDAHRGAHLAFADDLIARGVLVLAGRRTPPDGSIMVLRGGDGAAALAALAGDPYVAADVVRYEVVGTFTPGRHAPELAGLLAAD